MAPLPELAEIEQLIAAAAPQLEVSVAGEVVCGEQRFPLYVLALGNPSPEVPAVGLFGGVHGLERIGSEVVIAFLRTLLMRLRWDVTLARQLEHLRIVLMPLVNPGGLWLGTRANPRGVDLMRNAPVDSSEAVPMLLGGHRISASLPWYRGVAGAPMEAESAALCATVERELLVHRFSLTVDCHSGFGIRDRLWFPHAHTARPIEHLPEVLALSDILDETQLHHRYVFEPQSCQYRTHGDLWDHLYLLAARRAGQVLLPLTLEMGSWMWIKKNPRQVLSRQGIFNPLIEHRQQRVLRRHLGLLEFMLRAAASWTRWCPLGPDRGVLRERATRRWYRSSP